jgi:glycosyltransferase involved in cell wall biosynthesis
MKLLYLANARIPSEKAHPFQIVQMCEALARVGADVTLLYADRRNKPHLVTDDIWGHYGLPRAFPAEKIPVLDVYVIAERLSGPLARAWDKLSSLLVMLTYHLALIARLRPERDAVLYSRDAVTLAVVAALWPRRARRAFYEAHTFPRTRVGGWLRGWLVTRVGGVIVITGHLRERYLALGVPPERLLVAHDGVRAARFDLPGSRADWRRRIGWPEDAFVAGYMGRFHTLGMDKGLGDLVDAVAALAAADAPRPVRLGLVGGPDSTVDALRARLRERGCSPDLILYAGQVPPADVPGYLRAFDACVMPFPWTEHFAYYASPMKLFEYMASGSPLVATDLPSTAEIVRDGENGLLVPPADVAALAGALRRLRDDPALADRLAGQAAADVAAHYTWAARADRILDFVAECLPSERGKAAP